MYGDFAEDHDETGGHSLTGGAILGDSLAAFVNGELEPLREKLASERIILDFGGHALRLRGDEKVFNVARDAVEQVRKKYKIRRNRQAIAVECPVCFDEVSSPLKMTCGTRGVVLASRIISPPPVNKSSFL
jgi:hypothetical protein